MKLIKAVRGVYIPHDPEKPVNSEMRLLSKGVIGIIPDDFQLPKDSYEDLGKLKLKKEKED